MFIARERSRQKGRQQIQLTDKVNEGMEGMETWDTEGGVWLCKSVHVHVKAFDGV